jgi:hypothetical protein
MKEEEKHDVFKEEPVTLWQILFGKLVLAITFIILFFLVPDKNSENFIGYSLLVVISIAFISRMKFISMKVTHYLLFGFTGYFMALWILAMTQS